MIQSMTGFGRGQVQRGDTVWSVECSSVNRKQLEIVLQLPRELQSTSLETELRQQVQQQFSRGRIQVQVQRQTTAPESAEQGTIDAALAQRYIEQLRQLAEANHLSPEIDLGTVARLPGVAQLRPTSETPAEIATDGVTEAVAEALSALQQMRQAEGVNLRDDIATRLDTIADLIEQLRVEAPKVTQYYREQLQRRLAEADLPLPLDDDRLVKEVAVFADRSDISEELTRAASHLEQFRAALKSTEPVGRRLDFLSQEFFREFNTTGSKANHTGIAHLVVEAKTELEKIREQIQNIE